MGKKALNTTDVINELTHGSVFFRKENNPERTNNRTKDRTENRPKKRTVHLPIKRLTKRYSFEFYEDQITRIKKTKIEAELSGDRIAMSEIVREALDHYFETVRKNERSEERTENRTEKAPLDKPF
jgi:hypothetical protein